MYRSITNERCHYRQKFPVNPVSGFKRYRRKLYFDLYFIYLRFFDDGSGLYSEFKRFIGGKKYNNNKII